MGNVGENTLSPVEEYALFGYPHTTMRDCDFMESIISVSQQTSPDLLDIACGTGRHAIEMARRGYGVAGIDISEDMLSTARAYSHEAGVEISFHQCDMRKLDFHHDFDFAYSLFNSMGLLLENKDVLEFLDGVYDALRSGGLFVFQVGNLWSYMAEGHFTNSVFESTDEHGAVKRSLRMQMVIGPYNNIYRMHYDKRFWRDGIELAPRSEDVDLRVFSINELDLLLEKSGFHMMSVFGETDLAAVIPDTQKISLQEKPFHSYVVLAMKQDIRDNEDGQFANPEGRWRLGKARNHNSVYRRHKRRKITGTRIEHVPGLGNRRSRWRKPGSQG
jgi:SAM-dependent methyltransferase